MHRSGEKLFSRPAVVFALAAAVILGCAPSAAKNPGHDEPADPHASPYTVHEGDTLWSVSRAFGLTVAALAAYNSLQDAHQLAVGQRLLIPQPPESDAFIWPALGGVSAARYGDGIEIAAGQGAWVRASRSGRVAVAANAFPGKRSTVILDHGDGSLSVYEGLLEVRVSPDGYIRQGAPLGSLDTDVLHFEIRRGGASVDPLALLPSV